MTMMLRDLWNESPLRNDQEFMLFNDAVSKSSGSSGGKSSPE